MWTKSFGNEGTSRNSWQILSIVQRFTFYSSGQLVLDDISTCALINSVSRSECPTYALVTRDITCCWLAASLNQFGGRAPRRSETSARRDWTIWRAGGLEKARNGDVERGARRQLANDRFATHIETRQWKPSWPDQIKFGVCYKWNGTGHFRIIAGQGRLK